MNIKSVLLKASSGVMLSAFSLAAMAADTVDPNAAIVQQAFDTVKSQAVTYSGYAWPVAVSIMGSLIGIKIFKKFVNKAT
ncbi:phage coat protein [Salmonella enterica subsp. enterica serovar Rubislaw]|nr:phage coat protein [Salmonella enterica subsp. enterica serovar Rubislaw]